MTLVYILGICSASSKRRLAESLKCSSRRLQSRLATFVRALSDMKIAAISPVGPVRRTANNPDLGKPMVRTPLFCFLNQDLPVHVWFTDFERHLVILPHATNPAYCRNQPSYAYAPVRR